MECAILLTFLTLPVWGAEPGRDSSASLPAPATVCVTQIHHDCSCYYDDEEPYWYGDVGMFLCQVELRVSPPGQFPVVWRNIGSYRHCYMQLQIESESAYEMEWEDRAREWHVYWWIPTDDRPGGGRGAVRSDSRDESCESEADAIGALIEWFRGQPTDDITIQRRFREAPAR